MSGEQVKESRASYAVTVEKAVGDIPVAEMTASELKVLVQSAVEEVLREMFRDPDAGLELRPAFEERLHQARDYVTSGGHLLAMEELIDQLEDTSDV